MKVKCPVCYGEKCEYCDHTGEVEKTLIVWGHLQDAPLQSKYFPPRQFATYWGSFMEKLGRRTLREELSNEFFADLFPDVAIIATNKLSPGGSGRRGRIYNKWVNVTVDWTVVLHCQRLDVDAFEKNVALFEIKSSVSPINADHIRRWTDFIENPSDYIKKCKGARLFIMWIRGFDVEGRVLFYTLKEFIPAEIPNHFAEI